MSSDPLDKHKSIDLIPDRDDGKGSAAMVGKVRESVSEYSASCMDMRANEVLTSACE